jgi:ribosomal protein L24E
MHTHHGVFWVICCYASPSFSPNAQNYNLSCYSTIQVKTSSCCFFLLCITMVLGLCFVQHDGKLFTYASKTYSYHASLMCITMILGLCLDLIYYYVQHDGKIFIHASKTSSCHVPLLCIAKVLGLCLDLAYCNVLYMATHHLVFSYNLKFQHLSVIVSSSCKASSHCAHV